MTSLWDYPFLLFVGVLVLLWIASRVGALFRRLALLNTVVDEEHFSLVLGSTLTLLGLIIGFTFSMAVNRYDQRKNFEEEEANAIGTEYLRLDVMPAPEAQKAQSLMREYLNQRIMFYTSRDRDVLHQTQAKTTRLQTELWDSVWSWSAARPNGISALLLSGMNSVLNSEGYTTAIWRNRVPVAAWSLLIAIAVFANFLLGCRSKKDRSGLLLVLPLVISISFFLIAEIDSPRSGIIRIHAQNLETLADTLSSR